MALVDGQLLVQEPVQVVLPALQPVGLYVRGAPVVVRQGSAERREQAQQRVALRAVGAAQHCRVVQICRVARVAAQWVPVERLAARRLLARLHAAAVLRVLRAQGVVGAVPRCHVDRICRVVRVAAQWVPVERLAARRLLARLHAAAVLRVLRALWVVGAVPRYRVDHAADCCHVAQACRVDQPDSLRRLLPAVVAWWVGLRLASEPPL